MRAINDELGYPIVVGRNLLPAIAVFARERSDARIVLFDDRPALRQLASKLAARLRCGALGFALTERTKSLRTLERVLDSMLAGGVQRSTLVVGVGGGLASDLFGFAAATYMRGVPYAHVATSLTAMVDAAIGGKTGVNLRNGKNAVGSFRDPAAVFCEIGALETLGGAALRDGLAEVVKAAIIGGGEFFEALEALAPHPFERWPWERVVAAAMAVKTSIVAADSMEEGPRERLNLGHTFAHAIEVASRYRITHGRAVALGLRAAGLLALRSGRFSEREHLRVLALLALLRLPLQAELQPRAVLAAMRSDKKRRAGTLRFVLPRAIGDVEYGVRCDDRSIRWTLARLAQAPSKIRARR